jgi:hypothetical protein
LQIIPLTALLALALSASSPLLAGEASIPRLESDAAEQGNRTKTETENCALPSLLPSDLTPDRLAGFLPKLGSTPPDPAEVDRRLRKADACARAAGFRAPGEATASSATTDSTSDRTTSSTNGF